MKSKMIFVMVVVVLLVGALVVYQLLPLLTVTRAKEKQIAAPTLTPVIAVEPTTDTTLFVDEAECRAMCHIPDINEALFQGAKSQPPNHKDRTVCLVCHATHPKPILPPSHVGRMDPACALCHKLDAGAK